MPLREEAEMTTTAERIASGVRMHEVRGGGGLRLHIREWGPPDAPAIVFLHGISQNHQCWVRQYDGPLTDHFRLVAFDLRGHGMSEAPAGAASYTDGRLWADDLAAVIDRLGLDRPVLVGWSYGPFVIGDYLRAYGQGNVSALVFAGGAVRLGPAAFGPLIGPGFLEHFADFTADDLPTSIRGVRGLVHAFAVDPLAAEDVETILCASMVVPAATRRHLGARDLDYDDVLRSLRVPLLVSHGRGDTVVLPAMAQHVLDVCPTAEASWYDGVGHVPFLERPDRFNDELAALTRRSRG
jgi:non-heme chloroperoxidase